MATGQVICVLSQEMVGSSTSAAQTLMLRSVDALSEEKTQEESSARFGTGSREGRRANLWRKTER